MLKKTLIVVLLFSLLGIFFMGCEKATMPNQAVKMEQDSEIMAKGGVYNDYGYNYNAHLFNGSYFNVYAKGAGFPPYEGDTEAYLAANPTAASHWAWPYRDIDLLMKWNDAWLSNKDRDGDGDLDRHYGYDTYIGSGAWTTNHMSGVDNGKKWTYFTKIVAVPEDAVKDGAMWYTANGKEIGPVIWGSFATIQEVESGVGATYVSPSGPGFGKW